MIPQCLGYNPQVLGILLPALRVYQNIFNEDYHKGVQTQPKYMCYQIHKGCRSVSQLE